MDIPESWEQALSGLKNNPNYINASTFVRNERQLGKLIYPTDINVFNALKTTSYDNVKVVILGQDPYHGPNQANGLSFSVTSGEKIPPSLRNIYKEISTDINCEISQDGDLTPWAKQGVLLLNSVLTVEASKAGSHANKGWEQVTDSIIQSLNHKKKPIIFLLWGAYAQKKATLIDNKHFILKAPHPSPLSAHRGFLGCKHFSNTNQLLEQSGQAPIQWRV